MMLLQNKSPRILSYQFAVNATIELFERGTFGITSMRASWVRELQPVDVLKVTADPRELTPATPQIVVVQAASVVEQTSLAGDVAGLPRPAGS